MPKRPAGGLKTIWLDNEMTEQSKENARGLLRRFFVYKGSGKAERQNYRIFPIIIIPIYILDYILIGQ